MFQSSISQCGFQISATALPAPESYQAIGWLILTLAGIGGVVLLALQIIKVVRELRTADAPQNIRVTNPTQKREVTFPPEFMTAEQCRILHARVDSELAAIRADIAARDEASKRSREKIHTQLTTMETNIATLTERSANTNGWLQTVDQQLSEVAQGLANLAGRIK